MSHIEIIGFSTAIEPLEVTKSKKINSKIVYSVIVTSLFFDNISNHNISNLCYWSSFLVDMKDLFPSRVFQYKSCIQKIRKSVKLPLQFWRMKKIDLNSNEKHAPWVTFQLTKPLSLLSYSSGNNCGQNLVKSQPTE